MGIRNTSKKVIALGMCVAILGGGLLIPQRTNAYLGVLDTSLDFVSLGTTVSNWTQEMAQWAKEEGVKALRDKVVKVFVDYINKQTVEWIQCAGKDDCGTPKFVTDWQGFIKDAGMEAINQTISESKLADLCAPFAPQLRIALIPETKPISQTAKCTITDIVQNVQGFYDNFQNGGWLAYGEAIKPENNLYMQLVMFGDETKLKTNLNQEAKKQEAGAGSGFLSVSTCEEDNSQELFDECVKNLTDGDPVDACYTYADKNKTCTKKKVETPGDAVAGSVRNMIGSDNIFMSGVQSIFSAAINAGINRMMGEAGGLLHMSGSATAGSGINPSAGSQADMDLLNASGRKDILRPIQPMYDRWKAAMDVYTQAMSYIDQAVTNLKSAGAIQSQGTVCPPLVTQSEIDALEQTKAQLMIDSKPLQMKMSDATAIIALVNKTDPNNIRQSTIANDAVKDFMAKYGLGDNGNTSTNVYDTTSLDGIKKQAADMQVKMTDAITRLTTCKNAQAVNTTTTNP